MSYAEDLFCPVLDGSLSLLLSLAYLSRSVRDAKRNGCLHQCATNLQPSLLLLLNSVSMDDTCLLAFGRAARAERAEVPSHAVHQIP